MMPTRFLAILPVFSGETAQEVAMPTFYCVVYAHPTVRGQWISGVRNFPEDRETYEQVPFSHALEAYAHAVTRADRGNRSAV